MYTALFLALLGFVFQVVPGVEASLFGHELDIEAWSEASDMESMKYHWVDEETNSVLEAQAHIRTRRSLETQDCNLQRSLNTMQNALLRNTFEEAAFMICKNVVKYCDLYEHLNICAFTQWQNICVKTCDTEFNCAEGEVETCGVTENLTEEFKTAFLAKISEQPSQFLNTAEEITDAFFDLMGEKPPSFDPVYGYDGSRIVGQ